MALTQAQRILLLNLARGALLEKLTTAAGAEDAGPTDATEVDGAAADDELTPTGAADAPNGAADARDDDVDGPTSDPSLTTPAGCFVSLHEKDTHRLRGCVGRLDPDLPLWRVVRETAGDVLRDPRFTETPVTVEEIPSLELEVSVLSPPRLAADPLDFDPMTDGIYLIFGGRCGFFLPQVARDTGWTREQLLNRLCDEKLGLPGDAWRKPEAKLFTFKVEVIGPEAV